LKDAAKPLIIGDYTTHMGYVNMSDRIGTAAALARKPGHGPKKTLLPFLRPNHSEFIHPVQVLWEKYDPFEI
jgi:hypothetical protein